MADDVMIPLAIRGRVLELEGSYEFSEAHPAQYHEYVRGMYVTRLFQPRWGFLFNPRSES